MRRLPPLYCCQPVAKSDTVKAVRKTTFIVICLLVFPLAASAKDMNGKFGVGMTQTLGGVTGTSFRYWVSRAVGVEATLGVSLLDKDGVRSSTTLNGALGIFYAFVQKRTANLSIGVRANLGFRTAPSAVGQSVKVGDAVDSQGKSLTYEATQMTWQVNGEVPLMVEYFFSDSFSVNAAFGFVVVIIPDEGKVLHTTGAGAADEAGEVGFGVGAGGLFGTAGFTYYF